MPTNTDSRAAMTYWSAWLVTYASRIAAFFAARASRWGIVALILLGAAYMAYINVWRTVTATAPLPPGVTERIPELNTDLLTIIHSQRSTRIEAQRQQYAVDTFLPPLPSP